MIGGPKSGEPLPPKEKLLVPDEYDQGIIDLAKEQLPLIKESLKALVEKIIQEKPEFLVFMDKGARIFGTPIIRFLKEKNTDDLPQLVFFNDDDFKREYLYGDFDTIFFRRFFWIQTKNRIFLRVKRFFY